MKRAILDLRYFDGAGSAAGDNGGAAETAGGSAGTDGQGTKQSAPDGKKAEKPSAGTETGGAKDAEKPSAGAETGSAKAAPGAAGENVAKTDGQAAEAEDKPAGNEDLTDGGELLRRAAAALRLKAAARTARRWEQEAAALKEIYPDFSLEEALRGDRGFTALLKAGTPVKLAYEAAHLEEIMAAAMRHAAREAGRRMARTMAADAARTRENPVLDRATGVTKKDVSSLTEKEILKILRQVGNGEKVVF